MVQKNDSLKKRYVSKLISNLVTFSLGFITLGMVPRALGPEQYGNYGFLTNFFNRTVKFLKFGIPAAYYTKLSKRQNEKKLIGFYAYYVFVLTLLIFVGTHGAIKVGFQDIIWPGQNETYIFAAALLAMLSFISDVVRSTNDAFGYTFKFEIIFILKSILATGLVLVLYFTNALTLSSYFLINYLLLLYVIIAGWRILRRHKVYLSNELRLVKEEAARYMKEFYYYSHPLFFNSLVVYFVVIADRWLLQNFFGSAEQGYYTLALKVGGIVFLFTGAMSTLLLREMSLSYKDGGKTGIKSLFRKQLPLFYFLAAYFAIFISLNAETICFIIGGVEYKNASVVIAVMAFYPVHQTYGQLGNNVFLATEQTTVVRNIGVSTGILSLPLSFLLIAPVGFYGLGMGAIGLAIKMVLVQFISVNIYLWFNTKFLNLSFLKFFGHQIIVLVFLSMLAKFSQYFAADIFKNVAINFIISGAVYSVLVLGVVIMYPGIVAMNRNELNKHANAILKFITNKSKPSA